MERIVESLDIVTAMAPESVAASTDTTSSYMDASGADEITFAVSTAALGAGKGVTVTLMGADDTEGTNAAEIGEAVTFTDAVGTEPQAAILSYQVNSQNARYLAVKFQHDAAAAVICSVVAARKVTYRPAANAWVALR